MKGKYEIKIWNNKVNYKFEVKRKLTVIRGNSGTGKTTLVELIRDSIKGVGVSVISDVDLEVIDSPRQWKLLIENTHNSIIFIDEDNNFVRTVEFAKVFSKSDNYFVIITRDDLQTLPYSVEEIFEIKCSGKYNTLVKLYSNKTVNDVPDTIIVEDSNSGYEFFCKVADIIGCNCITAKGKSNISIKVLELVKADKNILIIADGAAFGSELNSIIRLVSRYEVSLFLPESFEHLLLNSSMFRYDKEVQAVLKNPYNYITTKYNSWEQFFTSLLISKTKGTKASYNKHRLNECYYENCCIKESYCDFIMKNNDSKIKCILEKTDLNFLFSSVNKMNYF